jgi:hypothetical protein
MLKDIVCIRIFFFSRYSDFHESYEEKVLKRYHWCKLNNIYWNYFKPHLCGLVLIFIKLQSCSTHKMFYHMKMVYSSKKIVDFYFHVLCKGDFIDCNCLYNNSHRVNVSEKQVFACQKWVSELWPLLINAVQNLSKSYFHQTQRVSYIRPQ